MTQRNRSLVLLAIQVVLVLSIAGKYVYERKVCPRVWVPTAQIDPNMPLRGRYMALQLAMDACGLPHDGQYLSKGYGTVPGFWEWQVKVVLKDGKLVPVQVKAAEVRPEQWDRLTQRSGRPCDRATLSQTVDYFIDDRAKTPFPLKPGEELWAEVTVPPSGPPRPIQLAVSSEAGFKVLDLR